MIHIDQFFVDVFGDFAGYARMLMTLYVIIAGGYVLARRPRSKRMTVKHYQDAGKTLLFFAVMAITVTVFTISIYFSGR